MLYHDNPFWRFQYAEEGLLIGAEGSGKTALLRHLEDDRPALAPDARFLLDLDRFDAKIQESDEAEMYWMALVVSECCWAAPCDVHDHDQVDIHTLSLGLDRIDAHLEATGRTFYYAFDGAERLVEAARPLALNSLLRFMHNHRSRRRHIRLALSVRPEHVEAAEHYGRIGVDYCKMSAAASRIVWPPQWLFPAVVQELFSRVRDPKRLTRMAIKDKCTVKVPTAAQLISIVEKYRGEALKPSVRKTVQRIEARKIESTPGQLLRLLGLEDQTGAQ